MSFQIIVKKVEPSRELGVTQVNLVEQIYEQTVEVLDLSKLIAAVNHKPRVRKPRVTAALLAQK